MRKTDFGNGENRQLPQLHGEKQIFRRLYNAERDEIKPLAERLCFCKVRDYIQKQFGDEDFQEFFCDFLCRKPNRIFKTGKEQQSEKHKQQKLIRNQCAGGKRERNKQKRHNFVYRACAMDNHCAF